MMSRLSYKQLINFHFCTWSTGQVRQLYQEYFVNLGVSSQVKQVYVFKISLQDVLISQCPKVNYMHWHTYAMFRSGNNKDILSHPKQMTLNFDLSLYIWICITLVYQIHCFSNKFVNIYLLTGRTDRRFHDQENHIRFQRVLVCAFCNVCTCSLLTWYLDDVAVGKLKWQKMCHL